MGHHQQSALQHVVFISVDKQTLGHLLESFVNNLYNKLKHVLRVYYGTSKLDCLIIMRLKKYRLFVLKFYYETDKTKTLKYRKTGRAESFLIC